MAIAFCPDLGIYVLVRLVINIPFETLFLQKNLDRKQFKHPPAQPYYLLEY